MNSRDLYDRCIEQEAVAVKRFPKRMGGQEDPDVLSFAFESGATLVTTDRQIAYEHTGSFPEHHPGVLVVASSDPRRQLTHVSVGRILSSLKENLSEWPRVSLVNRVVELTEKTIQVWQVSRGEILIVGYVAFEDKDWIERFQRFLAQ